MKGRHTDKRYGKYVGRKWRGKRGCAGTKPENYRSLLVGAHPSWSKEALLGQ